MKAIVNPITRQVTIKIEDCSYELYFDDLDSWHSFKHNGQVYDVHFHYDEQMWFHIYKEGNYEENINYSVQYVFNDMLDKIETFPNGFDSWYETHHEVVDFLEGNEQFLNEGTTATRYELAKELTDRFEILNRGRVWDGEYFDEIQEFLSSELLKITK